MTDMAIIFWLEKDYFQQLGPGKVYKPAAGEGPYGYSYASLMSGGAQILNKMHNHVFFRQENHEQRTALACFTFCGSIVIHDSEMYVQIYVCAVGFHHTFY